MPYLLFFFVPFYLYIFKGFRKIEFIPIGVFLLASVGFAHSIVLDNIYVRSRLIFALMVTMLFMANNILLRILFRGYKMVYLDYLPDVTVFVGTVLLYSYYKVDILGEKSKTSVIQKRFILICLGLFLLWVLETVRILQGPIMFLHFTIVFMLLPILFGNREPGSGLTFDFGFMETVSFAFYKKSCQCAML